MMMLAHTVENRCVIDIVQASLGLITESVKGIWFSVKGKTLNLTIAVSERSPEVLEDIDDIVFELEVLQAGTIDIVTDVEVLDFQEDLLPPNNSRIVYMVKRWS